LATTLEKKPYAVITAAAVQAKALNAETVTTIATNFLKRIGNKGGLKPKRVTLEEALYVVEIELKKFTAIIRIDSETHEIKGYEIQPKSEEISSFSISPKTIALVFGISAVVYVTLYFAFRMFGI
jgi:hypothetical protein